MMPTMCRALGVVAVSLLCACSRRAVPQATNVVDSEVRPMPADAAKDARLVSTHVAMGPGAEAAGDASSPVAPDLACSAPLREGEASLSAIAAAALVGYDPATSTVAVGENGSSDCRGNLLLSPSCGVEHGRTKVSARGRITLPDGRVAVCLITADCVRDRSGSLLVAHRDGSAHRVVIDAIASWQSVGDPLDCTLEAKEIAARPVLVEQQHDDGTCDNPRTELIVRSLTDPGLATLARLEVEGRVVPCGSDDVWYADHSTVAEFGAELRFTTTVIWRHIQDEEAAATRPIARVLHGSLRFVGDRLVDPLEPDSSETPGIQVGPHP
jgi:hypothetical protein